MIEYTSSKISKNDRIYKFKNKQKSGPKLVRTPCRRCRISWWCIKPKCINFIPLARMKSRWWTSGFFKAGTSSISAPSKTTSPKTQHSTKTISFGDKWIVVTMVTRTTANNFRRSFHGSFFGSGLSRRVFTFNVAAFFRICRFLHS